MSAFQFLIFSSEVLKDYTFLMFSGIRFRICGPLYVIVSYVYVGIGSVLNSFLIVGLQALKTAEVVRSFSKRVKIAHCWRGQPVHKFIYFFGKMFNIYWCIVYLIFVRYHRKNCCIYHALNEVLVREYDLWNYSEFLEENIQINGQQVN